MGCITLQDTFCDYVLEFPTGWIKLSYLILYVQGSIKSVSQSIIQSMTPNKQTYSWYSSCCSDDGSNVCNVCNVCVCAFCPEFIDHLQQGSVQKVWKSIISHIKLHRESETTWFSYRKYSKFSTGVVQQKKLKNLQFPYQMHKICRHFRMRGNANTASCYNSTCKNSRLTSQFNWNEPWSLVSDGKTHPGLKLGRTP